MKCAWASISETNSVNGKPGDQTKKEVKIGEYYNFGQTEYIVPIGDNLGVKIAIAAARIAENDNIGYGQKDRKTAYEAFSAINWDIDRIKEVKTKCNIDCSELALCAVNFAVKKAILPHTLYTGNVKVAMLALKDEKGTHLFKSETKQPKLKAGVMPLRAGHHIIVVVGDNTDYSYKVATKEKEEPKKEDNKKVTVPKGTPVMKRGTKGNRVKSLQKVLNEATHKNLVVDGIYGVKTEEQVKEIQRQGKISVDGIYGVNTEKELKKKLEG